MTTKRKRNTNAFTRAEPLIHGGVVHIGALGADFKSASLSMRDALYLDKKRIADFFESIPGDSPLREIVALSTCNRIELYYVCKNHSVASAWLRNHLVGFHGVPRTRLDGVLREYRCGDAIRHLMRVVSGTESMAFGEHEILGQVRDAYYLCFHKKMTASYLNRLFQHAIATGKKVRTFTGVGRGAVSLCSIAIERILGLSDDLTKKSILIVGAGTMGLRALNRLMSSGAATIVLTNRTDERAKRFCAHFNLRHLPFTDLRSSVARFDIVILATGSKQYLISHDDIQQARADSRRLLIMDLGAPRNADPAIAKLPGVTLLGIDDLKGVADRRLMERQKDMESIQAIIEEQVDKFTKWYTFKEGLLRNET